jgi:hypothetical protein
MTLALLSTNTLKMQSLKPRSFPAPGLPLLVTYVIAEWGTLNPVAAALVASISKIYGP